ncbi:hypothetical protein FIBSPDRAFT_766927 [Athelia psychrophila]|uniref:GATA-type domain-containing protein n=1 Tax=Athelia psychrophila TaxID=1759441 RepID=A0A167V787_9AGAM|nr:hypothetical protein FIBSPDRAFT_766927 [Fibularhizoctonia sp. CBS 109695]
MTEPRSWRRSTLNLGKIVCNKCGLSRIGQGTNIIYEPYSRHDPSYIFHERKRLVKIPKPFAIKRNYSHSLHSLYAHSETLGI